MLDGIMDKIVQTVTKQISPELRKAIVDFILDFEQKAKETSNPWDNTLAYILKVLFAIEEE